MSGVLHLIATNHAMSSVQRNEPWICQCIACRFTKEYKLFDGEENEEETFADTLISTLKQEGYNVYL